MDRVFIQALAVETVIGVFDWEREIKQTVVLDLEMAHDIRRAAETDCLDHALDYDALSKRLIAFIESSEFQLIETMAEECTRLLMQEFNIPWLRLKLSKPGAVPAANDVGLIIERGCKPIISDNIGL